MVADACNLPICDLITSTCKLQPVEIGTVCDDGLTCTFDDKCSLEGVCSGTSIICDDNNDCTEDICIEPLGRCDFNPSTKVGSPCDGPDTLCFENNICNAQGMCDRGTPKHCPSLDDCNTGVCVPETGECDTVHALGSCHHENLCMKHTYCNAGVCVGTPLRDDNECFTSVCDPETGELEYDLNLGFCFIEGMCIPDGTVNPRNRDLMCDSTQSTSSYSLIVVQNEGAMARSMTRQHKAVVVDQCTGWPAGTACSNTNDKCWSWACDSSSQCVRVAPTTNITSIYDTTILGNQITCVPRDGCHSTSVCEPTTGFCDPVIYADGTTCVGTNPQAITSQCIKGSCTPKTYHPSPPPLTECAGQANHTLCEDWNPLTPYSICINQQCVGVGSFTCTNTNPCLDVHYEPGHGCVTTYRDGAPCGNNKCLSGSICVSGSCAPASGVPLLCDPTVSSCNVSTCYPASGCVVQSSVPCPSCSLLNPSCPAIPCKRATCNILTGKCTYVDDDTNINGCVTSTFCGGTPFCSAGTCHKGTPPSCDDGNDCTTDTCNPTSDSCVHTIRTNQSCTSSNACATGGVCSAIGVCQPQSLLSCSSAPKCKINLGCNALSRTCEYINMDDGYPCISDNPCTQSASCLMGRCVDITPVTCTPPDTCHEVGTCTLTQGECFYPTKPDGFPCGDDKVCSSGTCTPITKTCGHVSHDAQCQTVVYNITLKKCVVVNLAEGVLCDTGRPTGPCSGQDTCSAGVCVDRYVQGTICRASQSECDAAEVCAGNSNNCPSDVSVPDDTPCRSDTFCDVFTCQSGVCDFSYERICDESDNQCQETQCDRFLDVCTTTYLQDGTPCSGPSDTCVSSHVCEIGQCTTVYYPDTHTCGQGMHCTGFSTDCVPDPQYDCSRYNTPCMDSTYDYLLDRCITLPKPDNTPCPWTSCMCGSDPVCTFGQCEPSRPLTCEYMDDDCGQGLLSEDGCSCDYQYTNPLCHPDHCDGGCTQSYTYWQSYNEYSLVPNHYLEWADDFDSQMLCGKTTYEWLIDISKGNAWRKLAQSYITAYLNAYTNGACVTGNLVQIMDQAAFLLTDCDTTLSVLSTEAAPYRDLVTQIDSYNTGTTGPGHCIADVNGPSFSSKRVQRSSTATNTLGLFIKPLHAYIDPSDTEAITNSYKSAKSNTFERASGFRLTKLNESDCTHGDWDYELVECICYYGWAGLNCDTCAAPKDPSKVFLCVPTRLPDNPYLLRQIPINKVQYYLGVTELTLPFVSIPNMPAFYPGTDGYDCFCNQMHEGRSSSMVISRNVAVSVTDNEDLYLYIDIIESDLGICEVTWEGNTSEPETTYVEVLIEIPNTDPWMIAAIVAASILGAAVLLTIGTLIYRNLPKKSPLNISAERRRRKTTPSSRGKVNLL